MIKILIADDDPDIRQLLEIRLKANNIHVEIAHDCEETIKLANSEHPDLILLDIRMPETGGLNTFTNLKMNLQTEKIPIIFITAYPGKKLEKEIYDMGASDFITKPFDTEELMTKINKALKTSHS
jgi:DNA-binding response OmpR family regulator